MILKYVYGVPLETHATVQRLHQATNPIQFLGVEEADDTIAFTYTMDNHTVIYGLGESVRGINKRGWKYESYNTDNPNHTESTHSLYSAHNFILVDGAETFGVFVDMPGKVTFDIGYTDLNTLQIISSEHSCIVYILTGMDKKDIVRQFRKLIGKSYIPPLWAFGFQQSRWGYKSADELRTVAKRYKENQLPIDAIYMDIDYMTDFKDFTVDERKFPDFKAFVKEMKEQNIQLVPIIDAGVKIEKGYDVYEEGVKEGHFCKDENGKDFVSAVWPGTTHFPDFLQEKTRAWFGGKYKQLTDMGIEGFWNDMNEPAIFYTQDKLNEAFEKIEQYKNKNLNIHNFFELRNLFGNLIDYQGFYHNVEGQKICHHRIHNLYGMNMTRSAAEGLDAIDANKRYLLFSRSSYIGAHRYGGIWTGDNHSWWSHILLCMKQLPSLSMCGYLYVGSDIGGFGANATEDLVLRWMALGVFTPLMRNHTALGTREQECYQFANTPYFKDLLTVRYQLIPYLYSEYMKAALEDNMLFKPLSFDYPQDTFAPQVEDQLMVGESIMIAPIYEQNAKGRYVYLPEPMLFVKLNGSKKLCKVLKKGHHFIHVAYNEVPLFIKQNALLPLGKKALSTNEIDFTDIEVLGFVPEKASYTFYNDDGKTKKYAKKMTAITAEKEMDKFIVYADNKRLKLQPMIFGGKQSAE